MLNKKLSIFLLIIIIVIVLSVIYIKINNKNTIYIGKIFHATGTLFTESEYEKYPDIIKNKKQLEEFTSNFDYFLTDEIKKELKKYDEQFFKKKSLVISYKVIAGGSSKEKAEAVREGKSLIINFEIEQKVYISGLVGYFAIFEVDKGIDKIKYK